MNDLFYYSMERIIYIILICTFMLISLYAMREASESSENPYDKAIIDP